MPPKFTSGMPAASVVSEDHLPAHLHGRSRAMPTPSAPTTLTPSAGRGLNDQIERVVRTIGYRPVASPDSLLNTPGAVPRRR